MLSQEQTIPQQDIAGFSELQKRAQAATGAEGGIGGYQQYLDKAQGYMGPEAYQQFLNPYQDYVTAGIEEQFGKALQNQEVLDGLAKLQVELDEGDELFEVLDADGDGFGAWHSRAYPLGSQLQPP